jgi:hypothetical protein
MTFSPELEGRLKRPNTVRALLASLENHEAATYELLFHAAFADRLFGVMRTAGPQADGFGRMQQTFTEAVEKVRSAIRTAESHGFSEANRYTDLSAIAMSNLLELLHDLSVVKQSSNHEQ